MLRQQWLALPKLIRFMLRHFANGIVLGWTFGLLVIRFDVFGIGSLLASFDDAWLTALFFGQGGLLFGALAMSVAVMNLSDDDS